MCEEFWYTQLNSNSSGCWDAYDFGPLMTRYKMFVWVKYKLLEARTQELYSFLFILLYKINYTIHTTQSMGFVFTVSITVSETAMVLWL